MEEIKQLSNEEYLEIIAKFKQDNKEDYELGKIRKVFLDVLPTGGGNRGNNKINWSNATEKSFYFICKDIEGFVKIKNYNKNTRKVTLLYNKNTQDIAVASVYRCKFQILLGISTHDYYYDIGDIIPTSCGSLEIINRYTKEDNKKHKYKWYQYKCLKCGNIHEIVQGSLKSGNGCNVCSGIGSIKTLKGYNDITTTHLYLIKYFKNIEDAYTNTYSSGNEVLMKCPDCGMERKMRISSLSYYGFSCKKCGDGISYPEKIMFNVFEQLGVNFETHKTFNWSKNVQVDNTKLCGRKEYDFYLTDYNIVTETHGRQHYEEGFQKINTSRKDIRTYEEEVENDRIKKELALDNIIKEDSYIVIDCRKSELEYVKNSILNNEKINKYFDLSKIDWLKAEEYTCNNLVKIACNYKKDNPKLTATFIANKMRLDISTVIKYLKKGTKLDWCNYKTQKESTEENIKKACDLWNSGICSTVEIGRIMKLHYATIIGYLKNGSKRGLTTYDPVISKNNNDKKNGDRLKSISSKPIICLKTGLIFESATECSNISLQVFGVELNQGGITRVCRRERTHYKGFQFKFIQDLTEEQIKEIQENAKLNQAI